MGTNSSVPSTHKQHERIVIRAIESGELEIDHLGYIWRVKRRQGNRSGGVRLISVHKRRAEHNTSAGYMQVRLMIDGKRYHACAHRLIWQHLNGDIPEGYIVNHKNGVKHDNRPDNLELLTLSENAKHAFRSGLRDEHGENNPNAKLTNKDIVNIRGLYGCKKFTLTELGAQYNVSHQHISRIVRGERRGKQGGTINRSNPNGTPDRCSDTGRYISDGK